MALRSEVLAFKLSVVEGALVAAGTSWELSASEGRIWSEATLVLGLLVRRRGR